jgi:hypothetical protein
MDDKSVADVLAAHAHKLNPYYELVGKIASAWSSIQLQIDELIWRLAEVKPGLGAAITSQIGSDYARIRILVALLQLREGSDPLVKRVKKFSLFPEIEFRNRAVHDTWTLSEDGGVHQARVAIEAGSLRVDSKATSHEELLSNLKAIGTKQVEIYAIGQEIRTWLDTSPQKWRAPLGNFRFGSEPPVESTESR